MALSSVQSASAYGFSQLQRQVALRNAEQLQAKAEVLAAQAYGARKDADEAVRRAGEIGIQAGAARSSADNAWQAVTTSNSAAQIGHAIEQRVDRVARSLQSDSNTGKVYKQNGQTGSASSYTPGSLVSLTG